MKAFRTYLLFLAILWGMTGMRIASAQSVSVQASVDSNVIGTEETLTYTVQVSGSDGNDVEIPSAPEADGLTLIQSFPSTQRSVSIVNGQMSQSFGFSWTFRPLKEGSATLSAINVKVGDRTLHTQPISVTVVAQGRRPAPRRQNDPFAALFGNDPVADTEPPPPPSDKDIFIRAIPSARSAFQGQQVIIEYQLYFREGIQLRQSRLTDSWDAEGFWREELDVETRPIPRMVVENGLRYNTIVLKRAAVFPTRAGDMSVDPLKIESEALLPFGSRDPFQSMFSLRTRFTPVQLTSPRVTIAARPLPADAPPTFNGAVGKYAMTVTTDRTNVNVGESIQVTIAVTGRGNLATLSSPTLVVPNSFDQYDPQISSLLDRSGRELSGSKTFQYVLIPRSNGQYEIPPIEFSYFDTDLGTYRTISSDATPVIVSGTATTPDVVVATTNGMPVDDFAPLFTSSSTWVKTAKPSLHNAYWVYLLLLIPSMVLLGAVLVWQRQDKITKDVSWARGRRAHPLSKKHLKQATALLSQGDIAGYYEELERAVLGFIGNRLNLAERGLTRDRLDAALHDNGVDQALRKRLLRLLDACDMGRFAPASVTPENMESALDEASAIIPDVDEQLAP